MFFLVAPSYLCFVFSLVLGDLVPVFALLTIITNLTFVLMRTKKSFIFVISLSVERSSYGDTDVFLPVLSIACFIIYVTHLVMTCFILGIDRFQYFTPLRWNFSALNHRLLPCLCVLCDAPVEVIKHNL